MEEREIEGKREKGIEGIPNRLIKMDTSIEMR